jgi:hypothetical protein
MYYINSGIVTFLTHILCDSYWIMGHGWIEYIYWLLMNFPDNLLTSCTSIEQVNLRYSHLGKIYYINSGIVTFLSHILCDSYWIMGDGRMEYMYWLLMNFPDNFLTTYISIEKVKLFSRHIGKIYYINSGIVTFLTHILCDYYWIMGDGQMEYIYWLLMNFHDNSLTTCTFIENVNLPSSPIGKIYYINSGIVTFLTHIWCVSLESWVTDRILISINFFWTFHTFWSQVALLVSRLTFLPVTLEKYILSTAG